MAGASSFLKADISAESLKKLIPSRSASGAARNRSRGPSTFVGLDIQPGYIAAVQARVNGSVVVQRAVGAHLPADTVREGEVIDGHALSEALRELFHGARLDKRVRVGVANQRTVLRTLEMPPMPDGKEMATAVRFQAEDQVPMPLDTAVLDYQSLGTVDTPAGPRQRVIVVAAQREMIERLLAAVRGAGLRPEGVDLSAFALIRSLYRPDEHEGRVLYLNVGGLTNMAIAEGSACRFTRVAAGGLESIATDVASRHAIPLAQARDLLAAVDLTPSAPTVAQPARTAEGMPPVAPIGGEPAADAPTVPLPDFAAETAPEPHLATLAPAEEPTPETIEQAPVGAEPDDAAEPAGAAEGARAQIDVRPVLEAGVREIAGEVRNSLDFHRSQDAGREVSTVVLSGAALQIAGFAGALSAQLGVPVIPQTVALAPDGHSGSVSPERLAVAAGLAVEEAPR